MPLHKHKDLEFQVIIDPIVQTMEYVKITVDVYRRKEDKDGFWESYREQIDSLDNRVSLSKSDYADCVGIAKTMIENYIENLPSEDKSVFKRRNLVLGFYDTYGDKFCYEKYDGVYGGFDTLEQAVNHYKNHPYSND